MQKARREAHMLHTAHLMSPKLVPEFFAISEHPPDIYIIQSLCPGESIPIAKITKEDLKIIMTYTLSALRDVHRAGIIHMDVKHENIIYNKQNSFKLIDFGSAVYSDAAHKPTRGTPEYMAPEVIMHDAGFESDVWSAGVMAYQLIYGKFPFHKPVHTIDELFTNILEHEPEYNIDIDKHVVDFIKLCLCKEKSDRPTASELLGHNFIAS
jgi:serine/threonine protein kinase